MFGSNSWNQIEGELEKTAPYAIHMPRLAVVCVSCFSFAVDVNFFFIFCVYSSQPCTSQKEGRLSCSPTITFPCDTISNIICDQYLPRATGSYKAMQFKLSLLISNYDYGRKTGALTQQPNDIAQDFLINTNSFSYLLCPLLISNLKMKICVSFFVIALSSDVK